MKNAANIVIADESALHLYMHTSSPGQCSAVPTWDDPLRGFGDAAPDLSSFNAEHPLYGDSPVTLLVGSDAARRHSKRVICRICTSTTPAGSFLKMRDGLYLASPELVFVRMGNRLSEFALAEVGMNLCARYYINMDSEEIGGRPRFLTDPSKLRSYVANASGFRGASRAHDALRWVIPNSGSPAETKTCLQYCLPLWAGGFALPFTHMNYDVKAGKLADLMVQDDYCLDLVNPQIKKGVEYDGEGSHPNPAKDKRRLNELRVLGWELFPIDKTILYDPEAACRFGFQMRKHLGLRGRMPKGWENRFVNLRKQLRLPS